MFNYRKRVERDLTRWRDQGWVTPAGETAIRGELGAGARGPGLAGALSILAAVLIGFAVMSFVAANWQDMPRLARLVLLFSALAASYGLAGTFFQRGMDIFGHAATLLGVSVFGASIMLIAQMYHMDGNPPDAVLTWAGGALLAGVALRSNPALAAAMALVALWGGWESMQRDSTYWPFLLGWGAVAAAFVWRRWWPGLHLAGLALSGFIVGLGYQFASGHAQPLVVAIGLAAVAIAIVAERNGHDWDAFVPAVLGYGMIIAYAGLHALQFFESPGTANLILWAAVALALLLAAIVWGLRSGHRNVLWLGYIGFSIEIMGIYFKTIGTLLGSSLFFLVAGLIVAGLAALAYRLHLREDRREIIA